METYGGSTFGFGMLKEGYETSRPSINNSPHLSEYQAQMNAYSSQQSNYAKLIKDLEIRLRTSKSEYEYLENLAALSEQRWRSKYDEVALERDTWEKQYSRLEIENKKLHERILGFEQELQKIIQTKYRREGGQVNNRINSKSSLHAASLADNHQQRPPPASRARNQNPHTIAPKDVRINHAIGALTEFFGLNSASQQLSNSESPVISRM